MTYGGLSTVIIDENNFESCFCATTPVHNRKWNAGGIRDGERADVTSGSISV